MPQSRWGQCLQGKVAVIAGNAYTIGEAAARLFLREGAQVVWIDDTAGSASDTQVRIDDHDVPFIHADVTHAAQVERAVRACAALHPLVHVLLNVAGRADRQRFRDTSEALFEDMLARNLRSVFLCGKHFLPLMKDAGGASIINQASIDAGLGNPSIAAYSAAKGGVIPLTHVMAHDLAEFGIRVNAISTGGIRAGGETRAVDRTRIAATPAGRMGTPEDVARVALFLASDLSAYVNGANIVVDGGRTAITQGCFGD